MIFKPSYAFIASSLPLHPQIQILALKNREASEPINLNKETEGSCSRSENSSDINLDISRTSAIDSPLPSHPNRPLFPSMRPTNVAQLLHPNPSRQDLQCRKMKQPVPYEESFCNMSESMSNRASGHGQNITISTELHYTSLPLMPQFNSEKVRRKQPKIALANLIPWSQLHRNSCHGWCIED